MFTSPIKRRVRWFHIVVVPWTSRKSTKKRADHVQSCCFAHRNNCFFFFFEIVVVVIDVMVKLPIST